MERNQSQITKNMSQEQQTITTTEAFRERTIGDLRLLVSRLDTQGNILRRTCTKMGETACAQVCAARGLEEYYRNADKLCADRNITEAIEAAGLDPGEVLMIGVTANGVGFGDQLPELDVKTNPEGFRELAGYNAFFVQKNEAQAIGCRLADCGHVAIQFTDENSEPVMGFMHLTKPNMQGESAYKFEYDGEPVSYFEYALKTALEHYGADIIDVQVTVNAAISEDSYTYSFKDEAHAREQFPGWIEEGLVRSEQHPEWQPGGEFDAADTWHLNFPELIRRHIERSGLSTEQVDMTEMLDPRGSQGIHSSNHYDSSNRDLYAVAFR